MRVVAGTGACSAMIGLFVAVLCQISLSAVARTDTTVAFDLEDQWGNTWSATALRGKPYVCIVADYRASDAAAEWGQKLGHRLKDSVLILGCANLDGVPSFLRWFVRSRIRDRAKAAPLLLDWEGEFFRAYRCSENLPTVLIVNAAGRLVYRYTGLPRSDAIETVSFAIKKTISD